eukprot:355847-Chlamydomonas_euryale.AAC.9
MFPDNKAPPGCWSAQAGGHTQSEKRAQRDKQLSPCPMVCMVESCADIEGRGRGGGGASHFVVRCSCVQRSASKSGPQATGKGQRKMASCPWCSLPPPLTPPYPLSMPFPPMGPSLVRGIASCCLCLHANVVLPCAIPYVRMYVRKLPCAVPGLE